MKQQLTFDDIVRWATPVASFLAEIQPAWDRMVAAATAAPAAADDEIEEIEEIEAEVEGYEDEDMVIDDEGNAVDMGTAEPHQHPRVWGPGEEPEIGVMFHVEDGLTHRQFRRATVPKYQVRSRVNSTSPWRDMPASVYPDFWRRVKIECTAPGCEL